MKIKEIIELIPQLKEDERARIANLMKVFSKPSINELNRYQFEWFSNPANTRDDFEKFAEGQNKVVLELINIETSEVGSLVRSALNLPPLTTETDIEF